MSLTRCMFALSVAGACASMSSAAHVNATFNSVGPGVGVSVSIDSGANWLGTSAGLMNFTKNSGGPDLANSYGAFCCDIPKHIGFGGTYDWNRSNLEDAPTPSSAPFNPMGVAKADKISELFGRFRGGLSTNEQFGGFQIAVWTIIYGNGVLAFSGGDRFDSATFAVQGNLGAGANAQAFLAAVDGSGPRMGGLYALTSDSVNGPQDQIVPAPGAMSLGALGGLVIARRRR